MLFFLTKLMAHVPPRMSITLTLQAIIGPSMGGQIAMEKDLQTAM